MGELDSQKSQKNDSKNHPKDVKTSKHASRYIIIGTIITIFNFALYSLLSNLIINNNDLLWLSTFISTAITTIVAYILHSKITWKERIVTKHSVIRFFTWNVMLTIISPVLTQFFSIFTQLYELAYNITRTIHLSFSYEFVLTTGTFILTSAIIMILNFFFYDKFVFGKPKDNKKETK